jgi:hypothetical protein
MLLTANQSLNADASTVIHQAKSDVLDAMVAASSFVSISVVRRTESKLRDIRLDRGLRP